MNRAPSHAFHRDRRPEETRLEGERLKRATAAIDATIGKLTAADEGRIVAVDSDAALAAVRGGKLSGTGAAVNRKG